MALAFQTRGHSGRGIDAGPQCEPLEQRALLAVGPIAPAIGVSTIVPPIVMDFDLDGFLDIATPTQTGISFSRNDGTGNFEPPRHTTLPSGVWRIAAGDLNDDGYLDLAAVATGPAGDRNPPNFSYGRALIFDPQEFRFVIAASSVVPPYVQVLVADIDPMPGHELITYDGTMATIFSLNTGTGSLDLLGEFVYDGVFTGRLLPGDIDGDGDNELIIAERAFNGAATSLSAFHRSDAHLPLEFTREVLYQLPGTFEIGLVHDLDGDGDLDIAGTYRAPIPGLRVVTLDNDGSGSFGEPRTIRTLFVAPNRGATFSYIGTLPGEGNASDLVVVEHVNPVFLNSGPQVARVLRLAHTESGLYETTRLLLQRVPPSAQRVVISFVGHLSNDGPDDRFDFVGIQSGLVCAFNYRAEDSPPVVYRASSFTTSAANGQQVVIPIHIWDPRDFLAPTPSLVSVEIALDINGNGVIDDTDIIVKRRNINAARSPSLSLRFRITQDLPRGTFDLLIRPTQLPGNLVGPTLCLAQPLTIV